MRPDTKSCKIGDCHYGFCPNDKYDDLLPAKGKIPTIKKVGKTKPMSLFAALAMEFTGDREEK
jgi:hypothetical protein